MERRVGVLVVAAALCLMSACGWSGGAGGDGVVTLRWYTPPEQGGLTELARTCTDEATGPYRIDVTELSSDPAQRRIDVIDRLRAGDHIDLIGLDTALTAELGGSDLLAEVPDAAGFVDEATQESIAASTFDGELVAIPWWYEPHLLWYRGSSAERAGLDTTEPIVWDDLIAGASRIGTSVQIPDTFGATTWVLALVAGSGGELVSGDGRDPDLGLDSPAGKRAAGIVETYAAAGVGDGPSADALSQFAAVEGGFLVGPSSLNRDPALALVSAELKAAPYPAAEPGSSIAPMSGISLAVAAGSAHPDFAFEAIECLTSAEQQQTMVAATGHAPSHQVVLGSRQTAETIEHIDVVRSALATGVAEPVTPFASRLWTAIDADWLPITAVGPSTPATSQSTVSRVIAGGLL